MRGFNIANPGYKKKIAELDRQIEQSRIELRPLPDKIAVKHLSAEHEIVRLETERKKLTDGIKKIGNLSKRKQKNEKRTTRTQ